ncbi:MarR family winged helix-turn-helix transcriptional regulator [Streptomyces odontomachi]|uniref:MarR family winged helix-turn-helix transcriptional regulator n=1 Tax=Streptomyces odontomachi TaxID=2944940 RepID=UPI00210EAD93|nr:MarR family winged helix-turn-helix transcriptional regulator [Streptomyces sp. ODS25]
MPDDTPPDTDVMGVLPHIAQLSNAFSRGSLAERAMDSAGLSLDRPAMSVLVSVHLADHPLRIGEIAERMQVVGPHVTRQVQELERRGLVRRVADPHDRRASLIEPTETGAAAADRYTTTLLGWFNQAIAHWPEQDRDDFGRLMRRFVDDLTVWLTSFEDDGTPP